MSCIKRTSRCGRLAFAGLLILTFAAAVPPAAAQVNNAAANIYVLTATRQAYTLFSVSAVDGKAAQVLMLDRQPAEDQERTVQAMLVAPDNQSIAFVLKYEQRSRSQPPTVFTRYRIGLMMGANGQPATLQELDFQPSRFVTARPEQMELVRNVQVEGLQWTPDQRALIVSVSDEVRRKAQGNISLAAIPLDAPGRAFRLGDAQVWAVAADGSSIGAIRRSGRDTLNVFQLDFSAFRAQRAAYEIGDYRAVTSFGAAYLNERFVFLAQGRGIALVEAVDSADPSKAPDIFVLSDTPADELKAIRASSDAAAAVVESRDGALWQLVFEGDQGELQPLAKGPVAFWSWGPENYLLIQVEGRPEYQIIDSAGSTINVINIRNALSSAVRGAEIVAIDW